MVGLHHFTHDGNTLLLNNSWNEKDNIEPIQPNIITTEKYAVNLMMDNLGYNVVKKRLSNV